MRTCSRCHQEKDDKIFYSNYDLYCIECRKEYTNNWNKKKKEKENSKDIIWRSFEHRPSLYRQYSYIYALMSNIFKIGDISSKSKLLCRVCHLCDLNIKLN